MSTVSELFNTLDKHLVLERIMELSEIGEDEEEKFDLFYANHRTAYEEILTLTPAPAPPEETPLECLLTTCKHGHIHVCGSDPDGEHYGLDFLEWEKWLALPVVVSDGLKKLTKEEILAHILYEMTTVAYSNVDIRDRREAVMAMVDKIKGEFEREFETEVKPTLH